MEFKTTNVFSKIIEAYNRGDDLIVNQGGQGSSKTISILQILFLLLLNKPNLSITIASYALPHLKAGVLKDLEHIFESYNLNIYDYYNKSEFTFYGPKKTEIQLTGIEGNEARVTGPRRDILYVNEANKKITYDVFELMNARTHKCTFIDFNPSAPFWFHDKIQPNFKHTLIKSTYLDNPYLPQRERDNLLSKKDKPGFENWWKVYGLGELGTLEGAIFSNWTFGEFDTSLSHGYGLDYGYYPDPDALVKVAIDTRKKIIYAKECVYKNYQGTKDLIEEVKRYCVPSSYIIAESANPRTNSDLKVHFNSLRPVVKTKTVVDWLRIMQNYQIVITEDSQNLRVELENYIWSDKKAGIPIDAYNHLIDAIRYYFMMTVRYSENWISSY